MANLRCAVSVLLFSALTSALNSLSSLSSAPQEPLAEQLEPTAVQPLVLVVQPADQAQAAQLVQSLQVLVEQPALPTAREAVPQVAQEGQAAPQQLQPQQPTAQSLSTPLIVQEQLPQVQPIPLTPLQQVQPQPELPAQSLPVLQFSVEAQQVPVQPGSASQLELQLQEKQQLQLEQLQQKQELEQRQLEQQLQQTQELQQQQPPVPAALVPEGAHAIVQASEPFAVIATVPVVEPAAVAVAQAMPPAVVTGTVAQAERAIKEVPDAQLHWSVWSLVQTLSFAVVVKALCMAGNVLVQLSPFPQVKRWEARNDTGEADAAPYVAICFGGWQWCFYGFFAFMETRRSGFLILVHSNCLGALLGTYYIFTFYKNCQCSSNKAALQKYLSGVAALVMLQICGLLTLPAERALFLSGLISSFCSFVGALSMLVTVPNTIRTKDSRSIPGMLVGANFCSALVWCLCGYMLGDMLVMGPNVVASFSNLVCLYLKFAYPSMEGCQSPKSIDDIPLHTASALKLRRSKGETITTTTVEKANEKTPLRETLRGKSMETPKFSTFAGEGYSRPTPCSDGTGGTF